MGKTNMHACRYYIIKIKFKLTKVVKCTMMMIYLRYNALYMKNKIWQYIWE